MESRDTLNFDFLEKGLEIVSLPTLYMAFQENCFSCFILLTDQISLSDCLYFLRYRTICVLQLFVSQIVSFEIIIIFLIKPFLYMTKKLRQKLKYLENNKKSILK